MITADHGTGSQGVFRALSDPTRRDIVCFLAEKDMTIGEVVDRFDVTRRAIKKHLIILEEGGLISVHPRGRERVNRLQPVRLKEAKDWFRQFDQFWTERLSELKKHAEEEEINQKGKEK